MNIHKTFDLIMNAYGFWEENPFVAVGFSGGRDSLALLRLTQKWCAKNGGRLVALHVNHRMRPCSNDQAKQLEAWCQNQGVLCFILEPEYAPRNQKQARIARYNLIGAWCQDHAVHHVLVGHHRQDQSETVAMRCLRGSGVHGLVGMRPVTVTAWGRLLRPLLTLDAGLWHDPAVIHDPSNDNRLYERVRVRQALTRESRQLCDVVRRYAQDLLAVRVRLAQAFFVQNVRCWRDGRCSVRRDITEQDAGSILWMLERIMMTVSGKALPARGRVLQNLKDRLSCLTLGKCVTAGGCLFICDVTHFHVVRENKRVQPCSLQAKSTQNFDGRFCVTNATGKVVTLFSDTRKGFLRNTKSTSLPIFVKKGRICKVSLVPCKGKVYGCFAPRMPLMGRRL